MGGMVMGGMVMGGSMVMGGEGGVVVWGDGAIVGGVGNGPDGSSQGVSGASVGTGFSPLIRLGGRPMRGDPSGSGYGATLSSKGNWPKPFLEIALARLVTAGGFATW